MEPHFNSELLYYCENKGAYQLIIINRHYAGDYCAWHPFLWDMGKQHSPNCDAAKHGVPSGAIVCFEKSYKKID